MGVVGGEEVSDEEAGGFEAPGWVGHRVCGVVGGGKVDGK